MAKEERPPKKVRRGHSFGSYTWGLIFFPIKRAIVFGIIKTFGILAVALISLFLLSGGINQVKTGETLVEYALDIGNNISNFLDSLGKANGPIKITNEGIYFKDAEVPEKGALDKYGNLINNDGKLKEWKESYSIPNANLLESDHETEGVDETSNNVEE